MSSNEAHTRIRNFRRVTDWLYRGAQPSMENFASLSNLKIKTVINLRWRKGPIAKERKRVNELGMNFEHISLNYWTLPTERDAERFLEILDDEKNHPVFVHCLHGADRTGVLIAMYRVSRCGWTVHEAYNEMLQCGHHRFSTWHFKLALWKFARESTKQGTLRDSFRQTKS